MIHTDLEYTFSIWNNSGYLKLTAVIDLT